MNLWTIWPLPLFATEARAQRLSIHSFRVWLACALLANGCTPEQIMQLLRWSSDAARRLYARLQEGVQASQLDAAAEASFESSPLTHAAQHVRRHRPHP